jgi:hypothetical protein
MIADSKRAADFVSAALKPNAGIGNILKGFVNTFATQINSANGKLVWDDSTFEAVEIDGSGNPTGKRVRITPGGIGISTDGGQTFATAITGAGILANVIIASELYALSSADGFTKLVSSGLKVFDGGNILRAHFGQYAAGKFGLKLWNKTGTAVVLDEDGLLQSYMIQDADNVASGYPLVLKFYLPPETLGVRRVKLNFTLEQFRAYSTGAASGGGGTSGPSSLASTDYSATYKIMGVTWRDDLSGVIWGVDYLNTVWWHFDPYKKTSFAIPTTSPDHQHDFRDWTTDFDFEHTHPLFPHEHDLPSHTHGINHTHTTDVHTHAINYGIFLSTLADYVSVTVDGIDRTAALGGGTGFRINQSDLDLTSYITTPGWHTVQLGVNSALGRLNASLFVQAFMSA